jgi:hypothetical protein
MKNTPFISDYFGGLQRLLDSLEAGELKISRHGIDVTRDEIILLKLEMAHLGRIFGMLRGRNSSGKASFRWPGPKRK